jgi:hypothetical protein
MRSKVIWSFLGLVALSAAALVSGCDNDATITKSGLGESCARSADCEDGLNCLQGACYRTAPAPDGGEGGEGVIVGPVAPVLGGDGESCTKRADCAAGLGCFNQRCARTQETGEGGSGAVAPVLGGPGETCGLSTDCGAGLSCLPLAGGAVETLAIGSNAVGVCTPIDSGLEPTGKTCGHECVEAADCCELPIIQQTATGAKSCTELALLVADIEDCDAATGALGLQCLAYSVYCDDQCGRDTWACEAGQCLYAAGCTKAGQVVGGCPAYSRAGTVLATTCNEAGECAPEAPEPTGCTEDAECTDELVADDALDTCVADECVCNVETGGCYRKCSENTDCPVNYRCDADTALCVPEDACTSDAFCVTQLGDIRAKCASGACSVPCEFDLDCNPGGLTNGAFSRVCGPDSTCVALGCSSDDECPAIGSGVRAFCAEPAAPAGGSAMVVSAITD